MRTNAILRIIIYTLVIVILGTILLAGIGYSRYSFHRNQVEETSSLSANAPTSFDYHDIQEIEIDWISGDILLETTDSDKLTFLEHGSTEKYTMVYSLSNGKLKIQFCEDKNGPNVSLGLHNIPSKDLVINVPKNWMGNNIEINSVSADINAYGLTIKEFQIENVSGECVFENCAIDAVNMETVSGRIDFTGEAVTLECSGISAKCNLALTNHPHSISMETVSGDLELTLPDDCGFIAEKNTTSGKITTDCHDDHHEQNEHFVSCGDGSCEIYISCLTGNAKIHHNHK